MQYPCVTLKREPREALLLVWLPRSCDRLRFLLSRFVPYNAIATSRVVLCRAAGVICLSSAKNEQPIRNVYASK